MAKKRNKPMTLTDAPFKGVVVRYGELSVNLNHAKKEADVTFDYEVLSVPENIKMTVEELQDDKALAKYMKKYTYDLVMADQGKKKK